MTKEEVSQYIAVSSGKSVIVERCQMEQYPGYIREVVICPECEVCLEFNVYEYEYGGLTFYLKYSDYDVLISSLEDYFNKPLSEWENITKTGFYPTIYDIFDIKRSGELLRSDFVSNQIKLPERYATKRIPEGYWKDLLQ